MSEGCKNRGMILGSLGWLEEIGDGLAEVSGQSGEKSGMILRVLRDEGWKFGVTEGSLWGDGWKFRANGEGLGLCNE